MPFRIGPLNRFPEVVACFVRSESLATLRYNKSPTLLPSFVLRAALWRLESQRHDDEHDSWGTLRLS
jgi:hypothetical protein